VGAEPRRRIIFECFDLTAGIGTVEKIGIGSEGREYFNLELAHAFQLKDGMIDRLSAVGLFQCWE
jgi:hypothetical protein